DAKFVRWRHLEAPVPARLHGLQRGGRLCAFVATTRIRDRLVVLDLLAGTPGDVQPLVGGIVRLALSLGCATVGTRLNPRTAYARAFRRCGFVTGRDRPAFQVLGAGPDAPSPALLNPDGWHVTYGDEDMDDPAAFLEAAPPPPPPPASSAAPLGARRILYLVDTYWNPHGGTEGQLATLIESLPPRWRPEL